MLQTSATGRVHLPRLLEDGQVIKHYHVTYFTRDDRKVMTNCYARDVRTAVDNIAELNTDCFRVIRAVVAPEWS